MKPILARQTLLRRILLAALMVDLVVVAIARVRTPFALSLDQSFFLPISYYQANTGLLQHPWWSPFPTDHLNWHGFLQETLITLFSTGRSWDDVYTGSYLVSAAVLAGFVATATSMRVTSLRLYAMVIVMIGLLLDYRARPELLASLFAIGLVAIFARTPGGVLRSRVGALAVAALLALQLLTHPALFLVCVAGVAIAVAAECSRNRPGGRDVLAAAALGLGGFVVVAFVCTTFIYHRSIADYLAGIAHHAAITAQRQDTVGFGPTFLINRYTPLLVLGLVPAVGCLVHVVVDAMTAQRRLAWQALIVVLCLAWAYLVYKTAIRIPATYYNFSGILPAVLLIGGLVRLRIEEKKPTTALLFDVATFGLAACALAGQCAWLVQTFDEAGDADRNRMALSHELHARVATDGHVCADFPIIAASPDFATTSALAFPPVQADSRRDAIPAGCTVFIAFAYTASESTAPVIPGFVLRSDRFGESRLFARIFRPSNFGYAVYEKIR